MRIRFVPAAGLAGICLMLAAAGCFGNFRNVTQYDLQTDRNFEQSGVLVSEFRNDSASGTRMQFRTADGTIVSDPDHQWILDPGALLSRTLNRALNRDDLPIRYRVSGSLDCFEVNSQRLEFRLGGFCHVSGKTNARRFDISVPLKDKSPSAIAAAAGIAAGELASRIAAQVRE